MSTRSALWELRALREVATGHRGRGIGMWLGEKVAEEFLPPSFPPSASPQSPLLPLSPSLLPSLPPLAPSACVRVPPVSQPGSL